MVNLWRRAWYTGFVVALIWILSITIVVLAQESPPSVIGDIPPLGDVGNAFLEFVLNSAVFASVGGGLLVLTATAFLKRLEALEKVPASVIKVTMTLVVVIIGYVANAFGVQQLYEDAGRLIVAILTAFGFTSIGADVLYNHGVNGLPFIGTSRDVPQLE